jgi:glycosyltransferase involved in cell wall biosynthesis
MPKPLDETHAVSPPAPGVIAPRPVFLVGTRWFGVLGPCRVMIRRLTAAGHDVYVFGQTDGHYERYDEGHATLVEINMRRSYATPVADLRDIIVMTRMARQLKPVVIHSFNPKPSLLSYWVSRLAGIENFFIGVTGLGNTFIRAKAFEPFVARALRLAAARAKHVFFQNEDDVALFTAKRIGDPASYMKFTGPGVDLEEFDVASATLDRRGPGAPGPTRFATVCRLLWQKGIREYVEAATRMREEFGGDVDFLLVGEFDTDHPDCVDPAFVTDAVARGVVTHIPWTDDVAGLLAAVDVAVLHSYREGAPRAILEASAMRLPTIGSDAIGVRELVIDGETGILVELMNVDELTAAMRRLHIDPAERAAMGDCALARIAEPFSLTNSSEAQLGMYHSVGLNP